MGNDGPPALNTTKLNRKTRTRIQVMVSRSATKINSFDPPLTAVWTAFATPPLAALFDPESSWPPAGQRLTGMLY
jgi:hypothetical protein